MTSISQLKKQIANLEKKQKEEEERKNLQKKLKELKSKNKGSSKVKKWLQDVADNNAFDL